MDIFLFDFDGVINDTLPIGIEVYNSLLKKYKIPIQFTRETFSNLFLNNFHHGLAKVITNDQIREKILEERAQQYIKRQAEFKFFPGIKKVLELLSEKAKIIIISSNRTNFIQSLLKNRGINFIDEVLGGDIEKSKVKKILWQKEKHPNSKIYYIGDTIGDIKEGKKADVITVGTTWGFHSRAVMSKEKPDFLFDQPSQLLQLL